MPAHSAPLIRDVVESACACAFPKMTLAAPDVIIVLNHMKLIDR